MANELGRVKFLLAYAVVACLMASPPASAKEEEGENPLLEIARSVLQESVRNQNGGSGLSVLSDIVQGFMQADGGKQIGNLMAGNHKGSNGVAELLSNLGSLWHAAKAANQVKAENRDGNKKDDSAFDPSIVGSMIDLFSVLSKATNDAESQKTEKSDESDTGGHQQRQEGTNVDWGAMLNFAGSLISSVSENQESSRGSGSNAGFESLLSFLPVLLSSISGQHNIHASNSIPHHSHEQFLPPLLENLHEYWDHFTNSEFGKMLWVSSGLSDLVKQFMSTKGQFEVEKIFGSLENNSFRRMWIKSISYFIAEWVKHITDPAVQKSYLNTVELVCNSFLKAQGYPKETHIDINRPAESVSALANAVFKKQFDLKINSEIYVKPAMSYIQELFILGKRKGFGVSKLSSKDIETKLSETLDSEIIEPILRVYRAFKFATNKPECAVYVICAINQVQEISKSGLKPGITKLASLGASWVLSGNLKIQFWDLYNAAVDEKSCSKHDKMCSEFHEEDLRATTEYYHNEL